MALDEAQRPDIHWRVLGQGPRAALALHCNLGHSGAFRGLATALDDLLTIEAPDMPSHGRSGAFVPGALGGQIMVEAIVDRLKAPVDVIGHSYGGLIAVRLAIEHPELVRSLSLYEPVTMLAARGAAPEEVAKNHAHMSQVLAHYDAGEPEAAVRLFVEEWGDGRPGRPCRKRSARLSPDRCPLWWRLSAMSWMTSGRSCPGLAPSPCQLWSWMAHFHLRS